MTPSLTILSSKADSNTWESFTRSELKLESVHQESPRSEIFRKRATKPLLKQKHRQKHLRRKRTGLLLSGPKSFFQIKVNLAFHLKIKVWRKRWEAQNPCCLKSRVKFLKSVMIWGAMTSAGVGPLCLSSPKSMQPSTRRFYSTLCFHLLTSFMEMLLSFSSRALAPAHTAKTTSKCFADHDITVIDWPANMPDLNPKWNLWDIFKRKMRNRTNPVPIRHRYLCNRYVLEPNQNADFSAMHEQSIEIIQVQQIVIVTRVCCFHIQT